MVQVGHRINDFECEAYHDGEIKKIRLSSYEGKWLVLFFYPADFTFVCPTELEDAADHYEEFKKAGAEILSVSRDTAFVHKAWHDESPSIRKINYPMVADPAAKLCRYFGTYVEETGMSLRASFIIDPDGVVRAYEVHDNNIGRSAEEILRKLLAAIFVRGHEGEVCPANWRPGKKTLKPGVDLIGKI